MNYPSCRSSTVIAFAVDLLFASAVYANTVSPWSHAYVRYASVVRAKITDLRSPRPLFSRCNAPMWARQSGSPPQTRGARLDTRRAFMKFIMFNGETHLFCALKRARPIQSRTTDRNFIHTEKTLGRDYNSNLQLNRVSFCIIWSRSLCVFATRQPWTFTVNLTCGFRETTRPGTFRALKTFSLYKEPALIARMTGPPDQRKTYGQ